MFFARIFQKPTFARRKALSNFFRVYPVLLS